MQLGIVIIQTILIFAVMFIAMAIVVERLKRLIDKTIYHKF